MYFITFQNIDPNIDVLQTILNETVCTIQKTLNDVISEREEKIKSKVKIIIFDFECSFMYEGMDMVLCFIVM